MALASAFDIAAPPLAAVPALTIVPSLPGSSGGDVAAKVGAKRGRKEVDTSASAPAAASAPDAAAVSAGAGKKPNRRTSRRQRALDAEKARDTPERLARTLFVGNLPLSITAAALAKVFQAAVDGNLDAAAIYAAAQADEEAHVAAAAAAKKKAGKTVDAADGASDAEEDADAPVAADGAPRRRGAVHTKDIESVRFRSVPIASMPVAPGSDFKTMRKAAFLKGSFDPKRDSMHAYVLFKTDAAAAAALKLNNALMAGRHLRVDSAATTEVKYDYKRTIFVGNLPYNVKDETLRTSLVASGMPDSAIEGVRIVRDKATNKGKGFAYVLFAERTHVADALALAAPKMEGRVLRITRCTVDGSAPTADNTKRSATKGAAPRPAHMGARGDDDMKGKKKGGAKKGGDKRGGDKKGDRKPRAAGVAKKHAGSAVGSSVGTATGAKLPVSGAAAQSKSKPAKPAAAASSAAKPSVKSKLPAGAGKPAAGAGKPAAGAAGAGKPTAVGMAGNKRPAGAPASNKAPPAKKRDTRKSE